MDIFSIEVLDNINDNKFSQLKNLIKEFAITVFIIQEYNLAEKSICLRRKYIENYEKLLSYEKLNNLKNDIEERVKFAESSILKKDSSKETRYYMLVKENEVIGFQTAQIRFNDGRIEGWRNFAYIKQKYSGKTGIVIDSYNKKHEGFLSNIVYENITEWFNQNNVEIEKTATGKNMYKNILVYIVNKGFVPEKVDKQRLYLIKDYSKISVKEEQKRIYNKYRRKLEIK